MSRKQGNSSRFLDFMAGKGFYAVLFVCVAVIAVSGYMLLWGDPGEDDSGLSLHGTPAPSAPVWTLPPDTKTPAPDKTPAATAPAQDTSGSGETEDEGTAEAGKTGIKLPELSSPAPAATAAPTPAATPAPEATKAPEATQKPKLTFNWPVGRSDVSLWVFSPDRLTESPLGDFRAHTGIDLSAEKGTTVGASAPGTVTACYTHKQYGVMVEIEHEDGYVTRYGNLSEEQNVIVGQTVKGGEAIGTVGDSAVSEQTLGGHLHFEILQNGEYLDPFDLLP